MGLAEEMRKTETPVVEKNIDESPQLASVEEVVDKSESVPAMADINREKNKAEQVEQVEQIESIEKPQVTTAEQQFADSISEKFITDELINDIPENRKSEFLKALDDFVIENFYHKQRDKSLDQIKLGKLLFKFYKPFLERANRYYFKQETFAMAGDILAFFKEKNI